MPRLYLMHQKTHGFTIPDKRHAFIQQVHETLSQIGEINNESLQEVRHPLQTPKMSNSARGRQFKYCLNL